MHDVLAALIATTEEPTPAANPAGGRSLPRTRTGDSPPDERRPRRATEGIEKNTGGRSESESTVTLDLRLRLRLDLLDVSRVDDGPEHRCRACRHVLTAARSIALGVGPVCARRVGGAR